MAANGSVSKTGDVASFDDLQDEIAAAYAGVATSTAAAAAASASASAAAASATAASDDADAAAASEASAASDAAAASASATTASTAATAASGSAATALASAVAAGAQIYADTTAGLAATSNGDMFVIIENGAAAVYENQTGSAVLAGYLTRPSFTTRAGLAASGAGVAGEVRLVTGKSGGWFEWSGSNLSAKVEWDTEMGVWVPPSSAPTGASGAWVRVLPGYLTPEMFGATGGSDDTDAVICMDNVLRETNIAYAVMLSDEYTTFVGVGDLCATHEYADYATADAALSGLADNLLVRVLADETEGGIETRYRTSGGAFLRVSNAKYNGMHFYGRGASKRNGFILGAGSHAGMRLLAGWFTDGGIHRVMFNGNNPSSQWGTGTAPKLNPDTELLVEIEGYGFTWDDARVRHSGGDGVKFRGIVGNFHVIGGESVSQYNEGWGWVIDRMSSFKASKLWGEGNTLGDVLFRYDQTAADTIGLTYWKEANIEIENIYSENDLTTPVVVQVEGGHFAPRIGHIAMHGTGGTRRVINLASSAGADDIFEGCQGGYFGLGGLLNARIDCDANSRNNTFVRSGALWTSEQNDPWDFRDLGTDNVVVWDVPDATAFTPDASITGDVSINTGSSNFVNNSGASAQLVNTLGGIIGPVQDYHSNFTSGPSHVVASGFNVNNGGTEINFTLSINADLPASTKQWYAIFSGQFEAHQKVMVAVRNDAGTEYYNWDSQTWTALGSVDAFGAYKTLRADRRHNCYALPVLNDGTARTVRVNVRMLGAGDAKLYHAWFTDYPTPALIGIRSGQSLGTKAAPKATVSLLTAGSSASAVAAGAGAQVFVTDETGGAVMAFSDGTNWRRVTDRALIS